ncbi:MAG TPA: hypothetical protein VIY54_03010 [Steroidobacteraceae bacterium]
MFIRKKPARPHALGEPILHENHKRPVTRRELIAAGLRSAPAVVMAPAWLGALLKAGKANAALSNDIHALLAGNQCNVPTAAVGVPVICFDLAGGANLVGSEVIVGLQGGQANFLSTAAYGKMGVPGNMVPSAGHFVSSALGLLWHSDGAILRGILNKATTPGTAANTNGAVIAAMSQNDTGTNPHNPMYGIAEAGAKGRLLTLIGTESTISGGNSAAPMYMIDPTLQPTKIAQPSDATALVNTGGATADPVAVAVLESQARITGGSTAYNSGNQDPATAGSEFAGMLARPNGQAGTMLYPSDPVADAQLKNQVRCTYVRSAYTADAFGNPGALDPTQDQLITGGASPIFTAADFNDSDIRGTATVMKLVLNGYAAAGTITMGGYDYHDSTRATGETRNFKAGQMIGAVLEYAQRVGAPVMIYVFSDGSLTSSSMVDNSVAGRGKLAWQGDNQSVSSTFFLVYSPKGRPQPRNGAASQQIGWYTADGSVDATSNPAANSVTQLVETVILNYLGLQGLDGQFSTLFPSQGLGAPSAQAALTAFAPIV